VTLLYRARGVTVSTVTHGGHDTVSINALGGSIEVPTGRTLPNRGTTHDWRVFIVWRRVTGVIAVGIAGSLLLASPAFANFSIPLQVNQEGKTAADFEHKQCGAGDKFVTVLNLKSDEDGWHFVAPANKNLVSLHLVFSKAGQADRTVDVTKIFPQIDTQSAPFGRGFIAVTGVDNHTSAFVATKAGWKVAHGTMAIGEGDAPAEGPGFLVVSDTCVGTPATTPPSSSPPAPTSPPAPPTTGGVTSPASGGGLPVTGAALTGVTLTAVGLVVGGGAALFFARRRRENQTTP
jgi:LPXTG-motif cell wall-anchored protein